MNTAVNELAISVLKKPLHECSADEIRQLAHQYPWFGPGQLLLAKKLQAGNSFLFEDQVQKTSLYFQNRLWLHHLLNDTGMPGMAVNNQPVSAKNNIAENKEQNKREVRAVTDFNFINESEIKTKPTIEEPAVQAQTARLDEPVMIEAKEIEIIAARNENPVKQAENEPALVMPQFKIEPLAEGTKLVFEPYHTVDYFASLGIKFKEEEKPKDLFGQQLKSFTEWLKTMKRIPVSDIPTVTEASVDSKVEQMAAHSLAARHVITEAMAEVWEKQGDKEKAEDIYRKLSLLDPLKTAYFASKIEALKKTS